MKTLIAPVMVLVAWSLVIWLWMYVQRLPAMKRAGIKPQDAAVPGSRSGLPASVRQAADNYNHLMEQPTLFYAVCAVLTLSDTGNGVNAWIAWAYVGLRIAHSAVQALINIIAVRFFLFVASTVCLMALAVRAAMAVF